MTLCRVKRVAAITLFCSLIGVRSGTAQVVDSNLWGVNGTVQGIIRAGDTLYVTGDFTTAGPNTGGGVPVDRVSGSPRAPYGRVAGRVAAVVSDGAGGWFIGGHFTAVEGVTRANLAHVLADGSVSPWNPSIVGEEGYVEAGGLERRAAGVSALALRGSTLYVGGRFTSACGQSRRNLAAIDVATAALSDWNPDVDDEVRCLTLAGNTVYIGGEFRRVGDFERHHIAALSARTGAPTDWNPDAENRVRSIALDGGTVYAGGDFIAIGGQPRAALAALDAVSGHATSWDPRLGPARESLPHYDWIWPYVSALAIRGHTLFVGGWFSRFGSDRRFNFAAFDTHSGALTPFAPEPDSAPFALLVVGNTLYAGGDWYHVDGVAVPHVAAFDLGREVRTPWNPKANADVQALAADDRSIYVGGDFTSIHDWELRDGFAALDLRTGRLVDGEIANPFTTNPDPVQSRLDGPLYGSVVANGRRYLVGGFVRVNGQFHPYLAALDAATGELVPWDPLANPENRVFGGFRVLAARGNTIYVGGNFAGPSWFPRTDLAALDGTSGALLPWDPHPTGEDFYGNQTQVGVLTVRGDEVWVGGGFNRIGGEPRLNLAVLDATSGVPSPLRLDPDGVVEAIETSGDTVYVGGGFRTLEGFPHCGVAALFVPRDRTLAGLTRSASSSLRLALSLDACRPNPMRAEGVIGFRLPEAGMVSLTVYDTRGRRVATILDNQATAAGFHEAPFRAAGWAAGVYFCRLDALGHALTRKLIVTK
jgi:hypothetical protein